MPIHLRSRFLIPAVVTVGAVAVAIAFGGAWLEPMRGWAIRALGGMPSGKEAADASGDAGASHEPGHADEHGHDHAGHAEESSIELSAQARKGIGLEEGEVVLSTYQRTMTIPGMVVERAGRSRYNAIAPMTGYLTQILVTEGEAVRANQPLFEIRLTHEELVQAQADLLRTTVEIDVVHR